MTTLDDSTQNSAESCNDFLGDSHAKATLCPFYRLCEGAKRPKQSIKTQNLQSNSNNFKSNAETIKDSSDSTNSSDLKIYKIDCHDSAFAESRNDEQGDDSIQKRRIF